MTDVSTLSKAYKSPAQKRAKQERHAANVEMRRQLNAQKATKSDANARAVIQAQIDEIGKRGAPQGKVNK